jgi:hypothetical protein
MGEINIEFPFTICLYSLFIFLKWGQSMSIHYTQEDICLKKNQSLSTNLNSSGLIFSSALKIMGFKELLKGNFLKPLV